MNKDDGGFTRRDLVWGTLGATLGAALLRGAPKEDAPRPAGKSRVILTRDKDVLNDKLDVDAVALKKMLNGAMTRLTGEKSARDAWRALFKPGDVVGLVPTTALNATHAELTDAVRTALMDIGIPEQNIRNVQRDMDGVKASTALLCMPALKAHWLTGIGTVLKNYIMFSGEPRRYHDADSHNLGAIWNLPFIKGKTRLVLVDALTPLCDKGPQPDPRYRWPYKGLIAGTAPVAVETVGLRVILKKREGMRGEPWPLSPPPLCVEAADKDHGLGTSRWEAIELVRMGWGEDALIA